MNDIKIEDVKNEFDFLLNAIWESKQLYGKTDIESLNIATYNGNIETNKMNKFDELLYACQRHTKNYGYRFSDMEYLISIYRQLKIQEEVDSKLEQSDVTLTKMLLGYEGHSHDILVFDSDDNKLTSNDLYNILIKMKETSIQSIELKDYLHFDNRERNEKLIASDIVISNFVYIKDDSYSNNKIIIQTVNGEVPIYNAMKTLFYGVREIRDYNTNGEKYHFRLGYTNGDKESKTRYHSTVLMFDYKSPQSDKPTSRLSMKKVEEYLDEKDLKVAPKGDIIYTKEMDDNTLELIKTYLKTKLKQSEIVEIVFEKKNGDIRVMNGTLADEYLSEHFDKYQEYKDEDKPLRKESVSSCAVFDTNINQFRAVSLPNLISINGVKIEKLLNVI